MSYTYPLVNPENGMTFIQPIRHDTYPAIDPTTQSNLGGKSVFISGASKGIGRATALSYAKAGASQIAIAARSPLTRVASDVVAAALHAGRSAPQVLSLHLDVWDLASVQGAAAATEQAFGRLDVLVNNAGRLEHPRSLAESEPGEYWATWEINYRGVYWMTRAFLPLLIKNDNGLKTVVNLSSVGAHGLRPGMSAYQASKFALLKLSEFTCAEYAAQGVLAYSVHPGGVPTELALNMPKDTHVVLVDTPEMGADALVFLTQEKRDWMAGRYISLNWDMPTFLSKEQEIVDGDKLKVRLVV